MKFLLKSLSRAKYCNLRFISGFRSNIGGSNQETRHDWRGSNEEKNRKLIVGGTALAAFVAYKLYDYNKQVVCAKSAQPKDEFGAFRDDLPTYTLDEVSKHASNENRVWITFKEGVYDITSFVPKHPGGEQILLAAGSSVEPFWTLYAAHNTPHVLKLMEMYRIGNLSLEESKQLLENMSDPYSIEPKRHAALKPASQKPFCAEPPASLLVDSFLTPNELFFVRNHLPVPQVDPNTYELEVEVEGKKKTLTFTLEQLKKLPKHTITATVMCAGNRRHEMSEIKPIKGLDWGPAAISNATWTGVRLRDILKLAGVSEDDETFKHVQFEGLDFDPTATSYGASIPFWKAMDKRGDVLIAYEMNGGPISRDHGFPVRVIVPGVAGARNVKWLGRIIVSTTESQSHWQQNDYKGFSPSVDWESVDYSKSPAVQELPVISAICKPTPNEAVKVIDGHVLVKGYAWSGGGQRIVRVDVTADGGKTWHTASFDHQSPSEAPQHWSWTLWSCRVPVEKNARKVEIWAKAVDSSYNTQPESFKNIWNLRGVLSNAYHRVPVTLK